ncbi:hypothetical protein CKA32_005111 [Geitlerinema sp. FC II]|nr:hypothetical protein CKA32_005111 [Geitlerinema sp. FC II]
MFRSSLQSFVLYQFIGNRGLAISDRVRAVQNARTCDEGVDKRMGLCISKKDRALEKSIQILRSTPAIAESLAGGVAKRDRGE